MELPPGKIFINYRRGDTAGFAGRIYDRLLERFPAESIFMDVDTLQAGMDFVEEINRQVAQSTVFLAIIGEDWLNMIGRDGGRRIDANNDFVRLEIESALKANVRVIPVLIDDAVMPEEHELPKSIAPLARRHAISVNHLRFKNDAQGLVDQVEAALQAEHQSRLEETPPPVPSSKEEKRGDVAKGKPKGRSPVALRYYQVFVALELLTLGFFAILYLVSLIKTHKILPLLNSFTLAIAFVVLLVGILPNLNTWKIRLAGICAPLASALVVMGIIWMFGENIGMDDFILQFCLMIVPQALLSVPLIALWFSDDCRGYHGLPPYRRE